MSVPKRRKKPKEQPTFPLSEMRQKIAELNRQIKKKEREHALRRGEN